jgi:DNA polymerase III subunit beta
MKFTVQKTAIVTALHHLTGVVATRTTMPILSNIRIDAIKGDKDGVVMTATDLDLFLKVRIPATVDETGSSTLPARRLFSILKESVTPEISIAISDKNVASIKSGGSAYKINGLGADDYPQYPAQNTVKVELVMQQAELAKILRHAKVASSNDETRYVLNGVLLKLLGNTLTAVGTDGRRLATVNAVGVFKGQDVDVVIPNTAVERLVGLLGQESDLNLTISNNVMQAVIGDIELSTKLIDGTYPNYKRVIPLECKEKVALNRENLIAALRRASLMSTAKSESVRLSFTANQLTISASTAEVGESREELTIVYAGAELAIGFNPKYLLDGLQVLDEEEVSIELIDSISPGVIRTATPGNFTYVVMPLRLN